MSCLSRFHVPKTTSVNFKGADFQALLLCPTFVWFAWKRHQNNRQTTTSPLLPWKETMESTPFRDDPLPSYLENTKSTAYRWNHDLTDSTAHPSVGDNTTRDLNTKGNSPSNNNPNFDIEKLIGARRRSSASRSCKTTCLPPRRLRRLC